MMEKKDQKKQESNIGKLLYTDVGSKMMPVYERVDKIVVKTKEFDIDEFIQASNSQTDLAQLRQEMLTSGQLPSVSDDVVDCTLMPQNIHEVYDVVNSVDERFKQLPENVQVIFGNKDNFLKALVDGSYEQKLIKGLNDFYEKQNLQKGASQTTEEAKKEGN